MWSPSFRRPFPRSRWASPRDAQRFPYFLYYRIDREGVEVLAFSIAHGLQPPGVRGGEA
jgi:hypothetical protein